MADRLTRDGLAEVIGYLEAHYPNSRSKWDNLAGVYPTLAPYGDDVVLAAARAYVAGGNRYMPGPVDLLAEAKAQVQARSDERRQVSSDHPRGHVWEILDESNGMRRAECVLCGDTITRPADKLPTVGEGLASAAEADVFE